jgi:lipopolysaccharide transport system ATP-binding protein
VSFQVDRGDALGVVGRNGSGKSTLLQILAGTLQPTAGRVEVRGRVSALLELGSGFNPEFTGRENVHLLGTIQGLPPKQIEERFEDVASFADIGDFMEQPTKTYSSGMLVRLAFAAQTAVRPDIFIVDEALAVGDAPFQVKCFQRIREIVDKGTTVIFVSHALATIRSFCRTALWLHEGRIVQQGAMKPVCDGYERACWRASGMMIAEDSGEVPEPAPAATADHPWLSESSEAFEASVSMGRKGSGAMRMVNAFLQNSRGQRTSAIRFDEEVRFCLVVNVGAGVTGDFQVGFAVKTKQGVELISISDRSHNLRMEMEPGGMVLLSLKTVLPLRAGDYYATAGLFVFGRTPRSPIGTYNYLDAEVVDWVECALVFEVLPQTHLGIHGPVHAEGKLEVVSRIPQTVAAAEGRT